MNENERLRGFEFSDGERNRYLGGGWPGPDGELANRCRTVAAQLNSFYSAVAAKKSQIVYTPDGERNMASEIGRTALRSIGEAYASVERIGQREISDAADEQQRRLDEFAPPYRSEPWAAQLDLRVAEIARGQPVSLARLVALGDGEEIPPDLAPFARAALRLPGVLIELTTTQQSAIARHVAGPLIIEAAERAQHAKRVCLAAAQQIMTRCRQNVLWVRSIDSNLADALSVFSLGRELAPATTPIKGALDAVSDTPAAASVDGDAVAAADVS